MPRLSVIRSHSSSCCWRSIFAWLSLLIMLCTCFLHFLMSELVVRLDCLCCRRAPFAFWSFLLFCKRRVYWFSAVRHRGKCLTLPRKHIILNSVGKERCWCVNVGDNKQLYGSPQNLPAGERHPASGQVGKVSNLEFGPFGLQKSYSLLFSTAQHAFCCWHRLGPSWCLCVSNPCTTRQCCLAHHCNTSLGV